MIFNCNNCDYCYSNNTMENPVCMNAHSENFGKPSKNLLQTILDENADMDCAVVNGKKAKDIIEETPDDTDTYPVVYTGGKEGLGVVLDIGLKIDDSNSGILARSTFYEATKHYGGCNSVEWHETDVKMTIEHWKKISCDKSTKEICEILDIPYRLG